MTQFNFKSKRLIEVIEAIFFTVHNIISISEHALKRGILIQSTKDTKQCFVKFADNSLFINRVVFYLSTYQLYLTA